MRRFVALVLALGAGALVVGAGQALGNVYTVGNCNGPSPYTTVNQAVGAVASPGSFVKVCPGTYTEQVTIPAPAQPAAVVDGLTLQSTTPFAATIQAPAAMTAPKAIVRVTADTSGVPVSGVTVKDLVIQGPGGGGCDSLEYGVLMDGGSTNTTVQNDQISHIRDQPFSGCQNGIGVQIGSSTTTATATVKNDVITDYQKGGVVIKGAGSDGTVKLNQVTGAGPTAVIAQNGIQVSSLATGTVSTNGVSGNVYTPQTVASTGILLFGAGTTTVDSNTVGANDVGVYADQANASSVIKSNVVSGSTFDGITVDTSISPLVKLNSTSGGDQGIALYGTTGATVLSNVADGNASYGLFADSATSGNTFKQNVALNNGILDCKDASLGSGSFGTANTWPTNANLDLGRTSAPTGICSCTTTLAAAAAPGSTNIKVETTACIQVGDQITIDTGANQEMFTVAAVGTSGPVGTGLTLTTPITIAHAPGVPVTDP